MGTAASAVQPSAARRRCDHLAPPHAIPISPRNFFQKCFVRWPLLPRDTQPLAHPVSDNLRRRETLQVRNIKPSREKSFNQLKLLLSQRGNLVAHRRSRRLFFLSIPVENPLLLNLVDHDRSRNHISQAAILFVDSARDSADKIEAN